MSRRVNIIFSNEEDVQWFEEHYPKASLSWLCSVLLEKFRLVHTMTPSDYAEIAARELKDEL